MKRRSKVKPIGNVRFHQTTLESAFSNAKLPGGGLPASHDRPVSPAEPSQGPGPSGVSTRCSRSIRIRKTQCENYDGDTDTDNEAEEWVPTKDRAADSDTSEEECGGLTVQRGQDGWMCDSDLNSDPSNLNMSPVTTEGEKARETARLTDGDSCT